MSYGYTGNILHIDLSSRKHWIEHPSETFYRTYWGGRALALCYMLNQMKPHVDPLSPDSLLIFTTVKENYKFNKLQSAFTEKNSRGIL